MAAPDWFRISLTASDAMVERALPAIAALAQHPATADSTPKQRLG